MKSFSQLMANPSGVLCQLLQHNQTLKQMNTQFQATLPTPLKPHCYIANLRNKTLVVHTDSSVWATRLRYFIPDLLYHWQQDTLAPTIDKVEVKVRPPEGATE